MLFPHSHVKEKKKKDTENHEENAERPLINSLQNAFWVTKCEKYSLCPHKNATLNEASIIYRMG